MFDSRLYSLAFDIPLRCNTQCNVLRLLVYDCAFRHVIVMYRPGGTDYGLFITRLSCVHLQNADRFGKKRSNAIRLYQLDMMSFKYYKMRIIASIVWSLPPKLWCRVSVRETPSHPTHEA